MCGVEGETTFLYSFPCLPFPFSFCFFLQKIRQLKLVSLVEGGQSEIPCLSLKTNWYWGTKYPITYTNWAPSFPMPPWAENSSTLAGFRFHLHSQIEGKHCFFPELLCSVAYCNAQMKHFSIFFPLLVSQASFYKYPGWKEMEKIWITLLCWHCNCQLGNRQPFFSQYMSWMIPVEKK